MSVFTLLNLITWLYLGANNLNFRQIESSFTVNSKVNPTHRGQNFGVFFTLFIQKKRCFNFAVPGGLIIFDSQRLSITCNWLVSHTIVCVTSKTTSLKILREMHTYMSHFSYAYKMRYPLNLVLESWEYLWSYLTFYWPQRSCGQGYVFTHVCDSVNRGGL